MGIREAFAALRGQNSVFPNVTYGPDFQSRVLGMSVEDLWRTQPYLRTVVTFLARNIAQLGLHSFERISDTDRRRLKDDALPRLLGTPNPNMTTYELVFALVADMALYDEAFWLVAEDAESNSGWAVQPLSPSWITSRGGGSVFAPAWIEFQAPNIIRPTRVDMKDVLWFHGWNPGSPGSSSSPVEALKQILAEQIHAQTFRQQVWQKGGRLGGYLTRPAGAKWDKKTRENFQRQWQAKYAGNDGSQAGGTPILEDGMSYSRVGFSAHEEEYVEGAKLSFSTVASVYHVNPTMIGLIDNANFSNVREFRKMLYGDTLGSTISMIEDRVNTFLVPRVSKAQNVYVEFNIDEKLQGNFEEQATALASAVGAPIMTRNEGRALRNLPAIEGGDDVVTPLNVLIGGQSSPRDGVTAGGGGALPVSGDDIKKRVDAAAALIRSGFDPAAALEAAGLDPIKHLGLLPVTVQKPTDETGAVDESLVADITKDLGVLRQVKARGITVKAETPASYVEKSAEVLRAFFKRQRASVLARLGAKADAEWWDAGRWDGELSDDLYTLAVMTTTELGKAQAAELGFNPDDYDEARTLTFLRAVADSRAGAVNSTTRDRISAALEENTDPAEVFDEAEETRSMSGATALVVALAGFALTETATQLVGETASKTWVTGPKARPEHAQMDGETVGIEENFSNGAAWPGDPVLGAEGVANCNCSVEVSF